MPSATRSPPFWAGFAFYALSCQRTSHTPARTDRSRPNAHFRPTARIRRDSFRLAGDLRSGVCQHGNRDPSSYREPIAGPIGRARLLLSATPLVAPIHDETGTPLRCPTWEGTMTPLHDSCYSGLGLSTVLPPGTMEATVPPAQMLLSRLLSSQVLLPEEWEEVS